MDQPKIPDTDTAIVSTNGEPIARSAEAEKLYWAMVAAARQDLMDEQTQDALSVPRFAASVDPDEAERLGAFTETAITEQEAIESAIDLPDVQS